MGNVIAAACLFLYLETMLILPQHWVLYNDLSPGLYLNKSEYLLFPDKASNRKIKLNFDIQEKNNFAPEVIMNFSSEKLEALGWKPTVGLEEAYRRLVKSFEK